MRKAIDLFCGAGGLTAGLKRAGFAVVGAVDVDAAALESFRLNHPETRVWEDDIRTLNPRGMARALGVRKGELDLLAGCPPCQGFSSIRTLNGGGAVEDGRNDLVLEFGRFAEWLLPRAVMLENVPGLASDERLEQLAHLLEELGYRLKRGVLDAADYGVPQRRRRFLLVGGLRISIPFPYRARRRRTVRETIEGLPEAGTSGDVLHDLPERRSRRVARLIRGIPKNGGSREDLPSSQQLECHRRCDGFKDVYGRMAWDRPAPTITGGCVNPSKGRFLHPDLNRSITLREAALLQGFERSYSFSLSRGKFAAAEQIGNALPPPLVEKQGRRVHRVLDAIDERACAG